jgi:tagatose-1,6-bisphosphate aldolase
MLFLCLSLRPLRSLRFTKFEETMPTLGKFRHLQQSSTPAGHFCVLAIDHRENLRDDIAKHRDTPVTDVDLIAFKRSVTTALTAESSGLLTDPTFGFGPGIADGSIAGRLGLLSPLEVTDYSLHPSRRDVVMLPGWSARKIKRVGCAGVKLLVFYHPDTPKAESVRQHVAQVIEDCRREDIPLFLEPLAYSPDESRPLTNDDLLRVLLDSAQTFSNMGVDVLKMQFPVDAKQETDESVWRVAARSLNEACGAVPWALLSAGVDFATFKRQAQIACAAGASGVIVGRAVWANAGKLSGVERDQWLQEVARPHMAELAQICAEHAHDWRKRVAAPTVAGDWYESYGE